VSQTEHALQCAALAEAEGAAPALVAAALLHDAGHLLAKRSEGIDDKHEDIAWGFLKSSFGPDVSEPVRLHVDAKRYLCTVEPDYFSILSPGSVRSLELQGGKLPAHGVHEFRSHRFADDAIRLRRWDDRAKVPGAATRSLREYQELLLDLARR
jgi:predicted HD phosphohydrolase